MTDQLIQKVSEKKWGKKFVNKSETDKYLYKVKSEYWRKKILCNWIFIKVQFGKFDNRLK